MAKGPGRFKDNQHGWPFAFEQWLKRVGIQNGQTLTPMDLYALSCYHQDWNRLGISAPIYYSRKMQDEIEMERKEQDKAKCQTKP